MSKIATAINIYLTSKELIKEQIRGEEEHIKENIKKMNSLMKNDICRGHLKSHGHYFTLDSCYNAITYHQTNIDKLKRGDVVFLFELMSKEDKKKQALLNAQIKRLIEDIEEDIRCRQNPKLFKPESMSMDEFVESGNQLNKKLKKYISRLLEGDFELLDELTQSQREN